MVTSNANREMLALSYEAQTREDLTVVYDQWAASYDADASARNSAQPGAVAKMCLDLITDQDASILDVGAGTGLIGETLRTGGLHNIAALDPSGKMLAEAKIKGIYQSYYQNYLGDPLPFDAGTFDAILASGIFTLGHVDASVFPELNRILKASGKMIFSLNTKLLNDAGFKRLLEESEALNWYVERIGENFDMMDSQYSTAKAIVVVLRKLS